MLLEVLYHCTHLGGDVNIRDYSIGDRVRLSPMDASLYDYKNRIYLENSQTNKYFSINGLIFRMDAFVEIDVAKEREEKINQIIKDDTGK